MKRRLHKVINQRNLSDTPRRKGSVLVLVMTLLSLLFVIGVAFLSTINFEQDIIQAELFRSRNQQGVDEVFHDFSGLLGDGLMASADTPFGDDAPEDSITGFSQLPLWHNTTSPIEPYQRGIDGKVVYNWYTDIKAITNNTFEGPNIEVVRQFEIVTSDWANGDEIPDVQICDDGPNVGRSCNNDDQCPGAICDFVNVKQCTSGPNKGDFCDDSLNDCRGEPCQGQFVVDADGDGIVDTVSADAATLNFSRAQLSQLSTTVNGRPDGKVSVGLRIIPHNGLVNLNESHPNLIRNVLDLAWWPLEGEKPDRELNFFRHTPTQDSQDGLVYSPLIEEPILRRRGGTLPPKDIPPSRLFGAIFKDAAAGLDAKGDMQNQLLAGVNPDPASPRFWMYEPDELHVDLAGNPLLWAMRMAPSYSKNNSPNNDLTEYDRTHLVTTVSYDDMLSRGGSVETVFGKKGINQAMSKANQTEFLGMNDPACERLLPFEYANYPLTIDNDEDCCATDINCKLKKLKGHLQLSLSWLDDVFDADLIASSFRAVEVRDRLIYDVFFMLVNNASGVYWNGQDRFPDNDDIDCSDDTQCGPGPFVCDNPTGSGGECVDIWTRQPRREALISRTAASLTANLIDYVDNQKQCSGGRKSGEVCNSDVNCPMGSCSDLPTRIAVRAFDFMDLDSAGDEIEAGTGACRGGIDDSLPCRRDGDCRGGKCNIKSKCIAGSSLGLTCTEDRDCGTSSSGTPGLCNLKRYVYGLERQPFISEVTTDSNGVAIISRGVEIFNPYDNPIEGEYWIYEVNPGDTGTAPNKIKINQILEPANNPGGPFTAIESGGFPIGPTPNGIVYNPTPGQELKFKNGWIIYLVRIVEYVPGVQTEIVVDQLTVDGDFIAQDPYMDPGGGETLFTMQRSVPNPGAATSTPSDIWKVTVPKTTEIHGGHTLGNWNTVNDPAIHPVELNPSNAGLYAQLSNDPKNAFAPVPAAFPTTGSMLLLLRHANRSFDDYILPAPLGAPVKPLTDLSFTTWLDHNTIVFEEDVNGKPTTTVAATINESELIDNGRMPIFDRPVIGTNNLRYAAHHEMHDNSDTQIPGGIENLPWGQLVFDYFTTLPLSNRGPYRTYGNQNTPVGEPHARPRVDMDGLRVHGRIDINAAPWKVLEGLPTIPMDRIPSAYRARTRRALGYVENTALDSLNPTNADLKLLDSDAGQLSITLNAKSIVAYREAREGNQTGVAGEFTGDYGLADANGRAWMDNSPAFRRGTGFLTVGELANIRINTQRTCRGGPNDGNACLTDTGNCGVGTCEANNTAFRIDKGLVNPNAVSPVGDDADFVEAVALLVSLGDWITVRSDVYTMYGVIRGEIDETIDADELNQPTRRQLEDVEARSIRFQHTVDRLMTFFGEPSPVGIGDRIMGKYRDVNNN